MIDANNPKGYRTEAEVATALATAASVIDEIIFALNSLGKEKMISYHKEIEFLNKIRKL